MAQKTLYPVYMTSGTALDNLLSATGKGEDYRTTSSERLDVGNIVFDNKLQNLSKACIVKRVNVYFLHKHSNPLATSGVTLHFQPSLITNYYTSGSVININSSLVYDTRQSVYTEAVSYRDATFVFYNEKYAQSFIGRNYLFGIYIWLTRSSSFFSTEEWLKNLHISVDYEARYYANFYDENGKQIGETQTVEGGKRPTTPTAPKKAGYDFAGWKASNGTIYTNTLPSSTETDISFTAVYVKNPIVTSTVKDGVGGTISPAGANEITYGASQTYTITPLTGYYLEKVLVDGSAVKCDTREYTLNNVVGNHTIEVEFNVIPRFTISPYENGKVYYTTNFGTEEAPKEGKTFFGFNTQVYTEPDMGCEIVAFNLKDTNTTNDIFVNKDINSGYLIEGVGSHKYEITVEFNKISFNVTKVAVGGRITGPDTVEYGDKASYIINPDDHYIITDIILDGVSVISQAVFDGDNATLSLDNITDNHTINTTFKRVVYITKDAGANGNISGETVIDYGSNQEYIISADAGCSIDKIYINDKLYHQVTLVENSRTVYLSNLTEDVTIKATFTKAIVSLTVTQPDEGGYITGSENGNYVSGTQIALYATPDTGWYLSSWSNGATDKSISFNINENVDLTATFEKHDYIITVVSKCQEDAENPHGKVDPETSTANIGEVRKFTAIPDAGYVLSHWEDGSTETERNYTVNGNATLTAYFVKDYFEIKAHGEGGTVICEGQKEKDGKFEFESEVKLVATPDEGYYFVMWKKEVAATPEITVVVPAGGDEYVAVFKKYEYSVDVQHGVGAESVTESRTVEYGDDLTIDVKSAIGYKLADIVVNGESVFEHATVTINGGRYLISNIRADQKVAILFEERRYNFGRKLIDYYPPVIQRIVDFIELTNTQQPLVGRVWDSVSFAYENQFIDDATEEGIIEWEKDYGIVPAKTDTLKQRKQRLKAMWVPSPRYTYEWLVKWLKVACDDENIIPPLVEDYSLKTYLPSGVNYFEILDNMRRYVPANMHINPVVKLNVTEQNLYTGTAFRLKIKETLTIEREEVQNET